MTTVEILEKARELISDPEKWCKGTFAVDDKGDPVSSYSEKACKWCAAGAIMASGDNRALAFGIRWMLRALPEGSIVVSEYNDDPATTHADILALFDRAIEMAKAEQVSA